MKVSKTENRLKTGFQQPKPGFPKKSGFNIPNSFIHSLYFYSASLSLLLLRRAPDTAWILFHAEEPQETASEGLAQGPYVAARAEFEPTSLPSTYIDSTNEPPRPTVSIIH